MNNKKYGLYIILVLLLLSPLVADAGSGNTMTTDGSITNMPTSFSDAASRVWEGTKHAVGSLFSGLDELLSFFLDFVTGGAMTVVAGIAFFIMTLGKILMYVGLAFGPLLLALAPFRLTRPLALKWGEFMFGAMMYTGVATVVVMLCSSIFLRLKEFQAGAAAASATVGYVSPSLISLVSIMIAMMAGMIMWRVPSITAELFGGMALHTRAPRVLGKGGGGDKSGGDKGSDKGGDKGGGGSGGAPTLAADDKLAVAEAENRALKERLAEKLQAENKALMEQIKASENKGEEK